MLLRNKFLTTPDSVSARTLKTPSSAKLAVRYVGLVFAQYAKKRSAKYIAPFELRERPSKSAGVNALSEEHSGKHDYFKV